MAPQYGMKNNIKQVWYRKFVKENPLNVGIDSAILMNPKTWEASGHLGGFSDPLMDCKSCKTRYRADNLIEEYQDRDMEDILEYFDGDESAKAKLVSAQWSTEIVDGTLYGKVDLRLREELTESELTSVKDWITGQNSDGAFECLEDHPIDSEDGKLSISLWHGGNDYFVSTRDELDEYIAQQNEPKIGGM